MILMLIGCLVVALFVIVLLPKLQIRMLLGINYASINATSNHEEKMELINLENELRKTVLQIIGGLFLLTGVFFSWNQYAQTKERDLSEKLNKIVALMGSDEEYVQIGAVYSLKQVSSNHKNGNTIIVDILASYIREHAQWSNSALLARGNELTRAALQVISHTLNKNSNILFDISNCDFRGIDLKSIFLKNGTILESHFESSDLKGAVFQHTILTGSSFNSANLENASFAGSDLRYVSFNDATLKNVDFSGANLSGATGIDWNKIKDIAIIDNKTLLP